MFMHNTIYETVYMSTYESEFCLNNTLAYDYHMSDLRTRINEELRKRDWTVTYLAEISGVPQPTIQRFLKGTHGEPRSATIKKIAKGFGLSEAELRGFQIQDTKGYINTEPGPDIVGRVPLISWVQAGSWAEVIDNYLPGQAEEWRLTTAKCSKNAFALRVKGDSMTNPNGSPSIPEGYIIIVDPQRQANNGDLIVARLDDSMEATFKKLVIDGGLRYLKPLNPAYPVIQINGNCTIIGKVIKVELDL